MIQLTEVSIEGIKEYRRREREAWCEWAASYRVTWSDYRWVLNWTWETESIKNRKWEDK